MPLGNDEIVLCVEAFVTSDPAESIRQQANDMIAARAWSTAEVFYADQKEDTGDEANPLWSLCFLLGLDHIAGTDKDWPADVAALVDFVKPLVSADLPDATAEVRFRSRPWYSEPIALIGEGMPSAQEMQQMIRRVARPLPRES